MNTPRGRLTVRPLTFIPQSAKSVAKLVGPREDDLLVLFAIECVYECATPFRNDFQMPPPLPSVDAEDLVEVYNDEDGFASTAGREEDDDLFDAYDENC